jgi:hypothetical protein
MPTVKDSDFGPGRVGKLHVSSQNVKHTKIKGAVVKGKHDTCSLLLLYMWLHWLFEFNYSLISIIIWIQLFIFIEYSSFFNVIGVGSMATKEAKKQRKTCEFKKHKFKETVPTSWKTVSRWAPSFDKKCSMQTLGLLQ